MGRVDELSTSGKQSRAHVYDQDDDSYLYISHLRIVNNQWIEFLIVINLCTVY